MGDQQRPEAEAGGGAEKPAHEHEHQHQGNAGDDLRVNHGDVGDGVHHGVEIAVSQLVDAHGGGGAHDGGNSGGADRQHQGVLHGVQRLRIPEQLPVPVQGEAGEHGKALGLVEGEHQQDDNGSKKENHDQGRKDLGGRFHCVFSPLWLRRQRPFCWRSAA